MTDLFDELEEKEKANQSDNIRTLGGDLFDEVGIATGDAELMSDALRKVEQDKLDARRNQALQELNDSLSPTQKFLVGAGRGLTTIGRALGIADPEDPVVTEGFNKLADDSLLATGGEILGEAAPFLAAAPLAGAGLVTTTAGRTIIPAATSRAGAIVGATALGATEGATIAKGRGGNDSETIAGGGIGGVFAGALEAVAPTLSRLGRAVIRKLGRTPKGPLLDENNLPTEELQKALDEAGVTFDELSKEALISADVPDVDVPEALRFSKFEGENIPSTTGDISQDFAQQATEQRLLTEATGDEAQRLRQLKLDQSNAFVESVNDLVNRLGVPDETGDSIKAALSGRKTFLREEKNALYREALDAAPEVADIPLFTERLQAALPSPVEVRRMSRIRNSQVPAVRELLTEFGIIPNDAPNSGIADSDIIPLTLGTLEEFRQGLLALQRADTTNAAKVISGPILKALDEEANFVEAAAKEVGITDAGILDTLGQARQAVRQIKEEFDPKSIVGKLIDAKKNSRIPVIESSKVARELLTPNAPIENLQRTLSSLVKSGPDGKKAIRNLQSTVVLNALEDSLKAAGTKSGGVQTVGFSQFVKSLSSLGEDKLKLLFKSDRKALNRLLNLKGVASDIVPDNRAVPKGSAPVILDLAKRFSNLPGLAVVKDITALVVNAGADERALRVALKAKPKLNEAAVLLREDFPQIAAAIGIPASFSAVRDEEQ